jgi:RNA polymerase sigma factor (sigma-70 family)
MQAKSKLRALAGSALRAQPDRRLVRLAREGHDAAMEEIVRRYRPALVGYASRIVPRHRAEDVVQEALSRAMVALVEDERELKLKPWLYKIVRNRALNDVRDERAHERIPDDFDGVSQPPDVAERHEEVTALVAAIGQLPEGQREALVQREFEGRSHDEIAARLGSTPSAVRGLIFRARIALRDAAGLLVPLPLVRWLLNEASSVEAAAGGAAALGGAAGAAGVAGGGGIAAKSGVALVVATLAVGSGAALRDEGKRSATQAADRGALHQDSAGRSESNSAEGASGVLGSSDSGPSSNSGPGGSGDDRSGPGGGDGNHREDGDDSSGPGSGDAGEHEGHSGPGGVGPEAAREDNSGHGGGGSSGSSGTESSGSGSSGSGSGGSSGSGSAGSDDGD